MILQGPRDLIGTGGSESRLFQGFACGKTLVRRTCGGAARGMLSEPFSVHEQVAFEHAIVKLALFIGFAAEAALKFRM